MIHFPVSGEISGFLGDDDAFKIMNDNRPSLVL